MNTKQVITYILLALSILSIASGIVFMIVQDNQQDKLASTFAEKLEDKELPDRDGIRRNRELQNFNPRKKGLAFTGQRLSTVLIGLGVIFLVLGVVLLMTIKTTA